MGTGLSSAIYKVNLKRKTDPELMLFLKDVLNRNVFVVALGNNASSLFEILRHIDDNIYADGRKPVYFNPPIAGYKTVLMTPMTGEPTWEEKNLYR